MDQARQRLVRRHRPHRPLRWAGSIAAAAAVIILAFVLDLAKEPDQRPAISDLVVARADIDQSGRIDILDAFKLARHIELADRPEMKWDINGDGSVNRGDVDFVAFAAIRLDKGVL